MRTQLGALEEIFDPEARARIARILRARHHRDCCGACGRPLRPGEPLYRVRFPMHELARAGIRHRLVPVCEGCRDDLAVHHPHLVCAANRYLR